MLLLQVSLMEIWKIEGFKNIQPLTPNYESISFLGTSPVIEGLLLMSHKHFSGNDKETHSQLLHDFAIKCLR